MLVSTLEAEPVRLKDVAELEREVVIIVRAGLIAAAAAGAQRKHHDEGERQRHDFVELHNSFSPF